MITNVGKDIIAKYLIGQIPSYASYMVFGSGQKPLNTSYTPTSGEVNSYKAKTSLDFEMFRIPITSRGFVVDKINGVDVSRIVFTAELPKGLRYGISEVGIVSSKSNPSAIFGDSRMIYTFSESEQWQYHSGTTEQNIDYVSTALYGESNDGIIKVTPATPAYRIASDNLIFNSNRRISIYEQGRYMNSMVLLPGNLSTITESSGTFIHGSSNHIHLSGSTLDLSKNSTNDELRLAFSLVSKDESFLPVPSTIKLLVEFAPDDNSSEYAKFQVSVSGASMVTNRYAIVSKKLSELVRSSEFSWQSASIVKIYNSIFYNPAVTLKAASGGTATLTTAYAHGFTVGNSVVVAGVDATFNGTYTITAVTDTTFSYAKAGTVSQTAATGTAESTTTNFFTSLDAMRFENVSTENPTYGLVGYAVVQSEDEQPIVKLNNTNNYVEFRFGMDVI